MSGGELPAGWVEVSLDETGRYINGLAFKPEDWEQEGRPIVRIQNLTDPTKPFNRTTKDFPDDFVVKPGDILVSWSASLDAFLWDREPAILNQHIFRVEPNYALVAHHFLYHLLRKSIAEMVKGEHLHGSTMKHINRGPFLAHPVQIPPLNEQRRIVAKLDQLRARSRKAREALDEVPALLDQLKQSVLAAAFRGDLTAAWREQNPNVEPASKLLERIRAERRKRWEEANPKKKYVEPAPVDAEGLPELPEGWCWASMEQVAWDITVGFVGPMQHRYVPTGVPFLRSQNVRENRFDEAGLLHIDEEFHADLKKSALKPGDVITVRSGAPGTTCVVPAELRDSNCADIVITRLTQSLVIPAFAAYFMNSRRARDQVLGAQVGVAQQHFNIGSMRKLHLPIPSHAEQAEIVRVVNFAFANVAQVSERAAEIAVDLNSLDQSILAKAFRGELVPQDLNDEPAEALLARVRAQAAERPPARKGRAPK